MDTDALKGAQNGAQGLPEGFSGQQANLPAAYLSLPEDKRMECVGGCGRLTVRRSTWRGLGKQTQEELRSVGILPLKVRGLCDPCYYTALKNGTVGEFPVAVATNQKRIQPPADISSVWEGILESGGGTPDLAAHYGVSDRTAYRWMHDCDLPHSQRKPWATRRQEHQEFIEELDRFVLFGLGTHQIAEAFSLSDQELIEKVDRLRDSGYTHHNLNYHSLEAAA